MATMPREAVFEMYLDGWTTITARQTQPITISRGRLDWAGDVSPSRFNTVLDNTTGDLNPDNPMSIYYGLLGRNTPIRFSYVWLRDIFGRTVVDGMGSTTPDGVEGHVATSLAYTLSGTAADFDVGGGVATMAIAAASTKRLAYLPDANHRRIDVTVDLPAITAPASGNDKYGIALRVASATDYVAVDVDVTAAGVVRIAIRDNDDTTYLVSPTTVAGVVRTATVRLRAQVEGQTIRGKVWNPSGSNEPYAFHAEAVSTSMATTGGIGLRAETGVGNTNVTFTWDDLIVSSVRFYGYANKVSARSSSDGSDKYTVIQGSSVLNRLDRGKKPIKSCLRREIEKSDPLVYWPLEDGVLATSAASGLVTGSPMSGSINFSATDGPPGSDPVVDLNSFGRLTGAVPASGSATDWRVEIVVKFPLANAVAASVKVLSIETEGTISEFAVVGEDDPDRKFNIATTLAGGGIIPHLSTVDCFDGAWHHVRVRAVQSGADIVTNLDIDGVNRYTITTVTSTLGKITRISVQTFEDAETGTLPAVGHLAGWAPYAPTVTVDTAAAAFGNTGETAGRRVERLCEESGNTFTYLGDLDASVAMGPQRSETLLALLTECADTDFGTLAESRSAPGLVLRTGATLYNQAAAVTLSYSGGQLTGSFHPEHDDQTIINDVTARQPAGTQSHVVQDTGTLNTGDPGDDPDAVGVYDKSIPVNPETTGLLADIASWLLHLGIGPEARFPAVTVNAASLNITAALDAELLSLDVDDRIIVNNVTSIDRYEPVTQLVRGYTETLDTIFSSELEFTCAPEAPYHIGVWDDAAFRWGSETTTLNEDLTTTETAADVAIADGVLWSADDQPFDVMVGGERMTVTAVSGSSSPQTLTVTRSVNGVVKTHSTGARVSLADPVYWGLEGD